MDIVVLDGDVRPAKDVTIEPTDGGPITARFDTTGVLHCSHEYESIHVIIDETLYMLEDCFVSSAQSTAYERLGVMEIEALKMRTRNL
jgi:hypothetical protein